jgi:hypothetical protein
MVLRRPSEPARITGDVKYCFTFPVTAFYKGESQEKNFLGDWKKRACSLCSPAHVMLRGSGDFLCLQIHFVVVTTLSASDANKQCGCEVPTMVLSETRGL